MIIDILKLFIGYIGLWWPAFVFSIQCDVICVVAIVTGMLTFHPSIQSLGGTSTFRLLYSDLWVWNCYASNKVCFAGVQGSGNYLAGFYCVLDSVLLHQRHLSAVPVVSETVVWRDRRRDARRLVGLRVVHSQSDRLHIVQRSISCRFPPHSDVQTSWRKHRTEGDIEPWGTTSSCRWSRIQ